jgi:hypothetical protein
MKTMGTRRFCLVIVSIPLAVPIGTNLNEVFLSRASLYSKIAFLLFLLPARLNIAAIANVPVVAITGDSG